ncbi:bifunctional proline dehydrogenase/L-glutamate gamma-semialdehyde dehydrogenase PutA [Sphingosinicella sp. BN140058]|uniref:bifunctional proline dehydrogenase/L-glutamate gamma-semialdehyde dehydrogenase PutA n=1 Tax=Sphingosinicella sp. BN140058 TaxID=1892855 RepID=UPI001010B608|nr:bifunctional proline dehydrogenase/L-glutamate gamma-semialdehyde dehydrogenase PutA [Sphingosinicella sp. BN140058]QAY76560.1 bifunctional proline dehydrogenase/L-glutamate gamma-semialdehyde dehydrogenase PutA [Sphingosinicella sp. BN140058]
MLTTPSHRDAIRRLHRAAEPEILIPLLRDAALTPDARRRVESRALGILAELRAAQSSGWVNQFLQEYRLNTSEGVALLSLAEAFLRVPDPETADALIADKLGNADWRAHAGKSHSKLVNSATWGLVIGRALVGESEQASALKRLFSRAGEPFVRQAVGAAMRLMGEIFVMGRTIDEAIGRVDKKENRGFTASFDMLGESARTFDDARRYFVSYEQAIRAVGKVANRGHSISVKLSALHPRYEVAHYESSVSSLIEQVEALATLAKELGIAFTIDAEESERLEMSLDIIEAVAGLPALKGWDGLGMAVQAYGKRCRPVLAWADAVGAATGRRIAVRLVKGAYWDSEIKRTQEQGLADYPLFTRKASTDVSYLACARDMLAAKNIYPAFATHNALTVATILEWAGDSRDFEFQRLHGMGEGLYEQLVREQGYHTRIYAPVGGHRDLLAYLVRRLLENGANSSFVHQLADERLSDADILADPVAKIAAVAGSRHPGIPLPKDLFEPIRGNSEGLDLADRVELKRVADVVAPLPFRGGAGGGGVEAAAVTGGPSLSAAGEKGPVTSAGENWTDCAGDAKAAVSRALAAFPAWDGAGIEHRAACLDRLADLLEQERDTLMRICVQEAKKTIPDALAEVREAVDFCRYYAQQARTGLQPIELPGPTGEKNLLRMKGRGVWVCIAPWNFPLAIFLGQVSAALVTGNAVVAKPAPQTPEIAAFAVGLAHGAGVPEDVLILAAGGPDMGAALVEDSRIAGIAFTGSTATAKRIARSLLDDEERPIVPFIAETGGINAMIVDSTALPEQVVVDVVTSAFRSAGQRCSALRVLLLQEEIAERTLEMLAGAMDTLIVGDPADPRTDVGPVIDRGAYERLMGHREATRSKWVKTVDVPEQGLFVPPTLIRVDRIEDVRKEWFGPLLHVTTWKAGQLAETVERVNRSGFGLTMGLHSRIARAAETVEELATAGNLYVNRSMIGAIVGSQPFGGEGLSGTGPKAGGPHYLPRFCAERVTSTDTTSAGGNATLLSLEDVGL